MERFQKINRGEKQRKMSMRKRPNKTSSHLPERFQPRNRSKIQYFQLLRTLNAIELLSFLMEIS